MADTILHIRLDIMKAKKSENSYFAEPPTGIPTSVIALVAISTLLSFLLVLLIPIAWITGLGPNVFWFTFPLFSPPLMLWILGLALLSFGIVLHYWSRNIRQDMATSWAMSKTHKLVTTGPYACIRHPSYTSYFLCFVGLFLLLPSVLSSLLFLGFPGYYMVAKLEESYLLNHFGNEYGQYMKKTGRFLPLKSHR